MARAQSVSAAFEKTYGFFSYDFANSSDTCEGGGWWLGGSANAVGGYLNAVLFKFDSNGDTLWTNRYKTVLGDYGDIAHVRSLPGGRAMISGGYGVPFGGGVGFVFTPFHAIVDSVGTILSFISPFPFKEGFGANCFPQSDGTFLVTGWQEFPNTNQPHMYIARLDSMGNLLYTKGIGLPDATFAYNFDLAGKEGCTMVTGGYFSPTNTNIQPLVISLDGNGDTIFTKKINFPFLGNLTYFSMQGGAVFSDDYLVSGTYTSNGTTKGFLVKWDSSFQEIGRLEAGQYFSNPYVESDTTILVPFQTSSTTYIVRLNSSLSITDTLYTSNQGDRKFGKLYYDNGLTYLVGGRNFPGTTQYSDFYIGAFINMVQQPYVHDYCKDPQSRPTAHFNYAFTSDSVVLSPLGNSGLDCDPEMQYAWELQAPPGGTSDLPNPRFRIDPNQPGSPIQLIVTNSLGCRDTVVIDPFNLTPNAVETVSESHRIRLWPNPASTVLNISATRPGMLMLYDARGRAVRKLALQPGSSELGLSGLAKGLYLWRFVGREGVPESGKIVVE